MNITVDMVPRADYQASKEYTGEISHDYLQLLPKFSLQYNFDTQNNIYATVSKGYRSGGYNIQMFSDVLQKDMQTSIMKDVANATIPVVNNVPMIPQDTKDKIVGILQQMSTETATDVKPLRFTSRNIPGTTKSVLT